MSRFRFRPLVFGLAIATSLLVLSDTPVRAFCKIEVECNYLDPACVETPGGAQPVASSSNGSWTANTGRCGTKTCDGGLSQCACGPAPEFATCL